MVSAILAMVMLTILVTVTFIDAEHQVIPTNWTTAGSVVAVLGGLMMPTMLGLIEERPFLTAFDGFKAAVIGWVVGFGSLLAAVLLGKAVFGRKDLKFEEAAVWKLEEGHGESEQLHWLVGEEAYSWDDLFYRKGDRLEIEGHGFKVDGKKVKGKSMAITQDEVRVGERTWRVESLKSLSGKTTSVTVPREAMGMGDPHLLGMIGGFLGWSAVLFVIVASSVYAIGAAMVTRVGFGRPLPYGPFLALGAVTWMFGGYRIWEAYFEWVESFLG